MILLRLAKTSSYTMGALFTDAGVFYTLEPPWLDNRRNVSCIPPGEYDYEYLERSSSGKYRRCLHIMGVPGRTGILMHTGNIPCQTKGCILPGLKFGTLGANRAVLKSRAALDAIVDGEPKRGKLRVV